MTPGVRISYPLLYALADGEIHTFAELLERVRLFVPPNKAVRTLAVHLNGARAEQRYLRAGAQPKRVLASRRKGEVNPEDLDVDKAVAFVVRRGLDGMRTMKYVVQDGDNWMLSDEGRQHIGNKLVAGGIAKALRVSLIQRKKLI